MITKLKTINYTRSALLYCEKGGDLLTANKCYGNGSDIFLQMKEAQSMNDRCSKKSFHCKIRIAPEDIGILNTQDWIDISEKYASKIGFKDNMYAVYIHEEGTKKEHIHFVVNRINENNRAIKNNFTHYKNLDFCREIESEYNLKKVKRVLESYKEKGEFVSNDKTKKSLKIIIDEAIDFSDSYEDFEFNLKHEEIKIKKGRGIVFIDRKGIIHKGSSIGRDYSLSGILKKINSIKSVKSKITEVKAATSIKKKKGINF